MKPQLALELVRQDALQSEKISKNGYQRTAAVVCKGLPFTIEVKSTSDLRQIELYASLLYDYKESPDEPERPVESSIHVNVMEYKVHVNSSNSASVEVRIKVLSSQLSSLFRVKVSGEISSGKSKERTRVDILSNPIKVISKVVHPKKEINQKKTATELIEDAVYRLEVQNAENAKLISLLCEDTTIPSPSPSKQLGKRNFSYISSESEQDEKESTIQKKKKTKQNRISSSLPLESTSSSSSSQDPLQEFEDSFRELMQVITRANMSRDRASTYRRLLHSIPLSAEEHTLLSSIVDTYTHVSMDFNESCDSNITSPDSITESTIDSESSDHYSVFNCDVPNYSQFSFQRSPDQSSSAFPSPAPEQLQSFNHFNHSSSSAPQNFNQNSNLPEDLFKASLFSELESINL